MYYAYQPIVNIHTGLTLGFEALLRGYRDSNYESISEVFESSFNNGSLFELDSELRELAISSLYCNEKFHSIKIFYNLDNRLLDNENFYENVKINSRHSNIYTSNICFEISEKHEFSSYQNNHKILKNFRENHFRIAIDDFGSGYSGLTLLYHSEPDFIKIDRFFIENINDDSRKKFFVANVVNLAHMMGISVIAEGIETKGEFYICREIGCDYAQGYLIQRPEADLSKLRLKYAVVESLVNLQSRKSEGDKSFINKEIKKLPSVEVSASTENILERFRKAGNIRSFPVVNTAGEPLGLLRESDLKKYVYSPYGISILHHKSSNDGIESLIARAPVMEISNPIEKILELYSLNQNLDSVIITENGKYLGLLESSAILRILSEKKISIARDQNPLTKLPGNSSINSYLAEIISNREKGHILAYFDLDNFKPFNDLYGFRQGDRIIRLFADILREHRVIGKEFIGHIGGDDFFIGYNDINHSPEEIIEEIKIIIERFSNDVLPFYKEEDRERGYITAKTRNGRKKDFPFLSVSSAIVCMFKPPEHITMEKLTEQIAEYKILAKKNSNHISILNLTTEDSPGQHQPQYKLRQAVYTD